MVITRKALRRIKRMRSLQGIPKKAGVRLGMGGHHVWLRWDRVGPREEDLVVMKRDLPIFIDSQTYMRLADYELDFDRERGRAQFLLRHQPLLFKSK
jgi:Fe-S cluster assembly iron-binding protein IscA